MGVGVGLNSPPILLNTGNAHRPSFVLCVNAAAVCSEGDVFEHSV